MSTNSFPVVAAPQRGKIFVHAVPEDPPAALWDSLVFPDDPDPAIPPPPPLLPVLVETLRYSYDETRRRVLAVALQHLEGGLYDHLEKARPNWAAFPSSRNLCRLPGCPRYEGPRFDSPADLAKHLESGVHRATPPSPAAASSAASSPDRHPSQSSPESQTTGSVLGFADEDGDTLMTDPDCISICAVGSKLCTSGRHSPSEGWGDGKVKGETSSRNIRLQLGQVMVFFSAAAHALQPRSQLSSFGAICPAFDTTAHLGTTESSELVWRLANRPLSRLLVDVD
ncbi:hypothetical protein B0T18DRAFT_488177 [Schizothecium vesticola]|uniref:Uncharacterized protein n=1 Tax=Schizothecium vesticola TaxID=314040 RepID=A0AA40K9A2_9PEZI|nr:hypothetical protein B0T18DRAFT_488177 [Schizothecium vesticola]